MELTAIAQWLNTTFAGYDYAILQALHNLAEAAGGFFTPLCRAITLLGEKGILFLVLGIVLMLFPKTRKAGICMFGAVCCGALITNFWLKDFVARPRPLTVEPFRTWWQAAGAYAESEYSFPSGHVTAAMAGVTALVLAGKKPARWWAYLFVAAMGVARNYLMAHYPSDVLGGMIVGLIDAAIAYAITLLIYRIVSEHPDNRFCRFVLHGGIGYDYFYIATDVGLPTLFTENIFCNFTLQALHKTFIAFACDHGQRIHSVNVLPQKTSVHSLSVSIDTQTKPSSDFLPFSYFASSVF